MLLGTLGQPVKIAASLLLALVMLVLANGCAVGHVRAHEVNALARYRALPVRVVPPAEPTLVPGPEVQAAVQAGLSAGGAPLATAEEPALLVQPRLTRLHQGAESAGASTSAVAYGASVLGLAGQVDASRMTLELWLWAPGVDHPVGRLVWDGARPIALAALVAEGGADAGHAFADEIHTQRRRWVTSRAADERMILTPSSQLLRPGELVVSDDEVLFVHTGVGLTRWLQLDAGIGGLPIPAAGGAPFLIAPSPAGAGVVGGAGGLVLGALDLGFKLRVLEEGRTMPGVTASYDFVDLFGAAVGGGGILFAGAAAAVGAGGAANVQLNVFSVAAGKHFFDDRFQIGAGTWIIDNHHFVPQVAGFVVGGAAGTAGEGGQGGGGGGGAGAKIERLPTKVVPFVNMELVAWRWLRVIQEVFPGKSLDDSLAVTGFRFILGGNRTWGPFDLAKVKVKLDVAFIESYHTATDKMDKSGPEYVPWLGLGMYFQ